MRDVINYLTEIDNEYMNTPPLKGTSKGIILKKTHAAFIYCLFSFFIYKYNYYYN